MCPAYTINYTVYCYIIETDRVQRGVAGKGGKKASAERES